MQGYHVAKKTEIIDLPIPPVPKFLLDPNDVEYQKPEPQSPETLRAKMQLAAAEAMDILEWHAKNIADPKMSQEACRDILDRAGFGKPKVGEAPPAGSIEPGVSVPPIEDHVRSLSDAFAEIKVQQTDFEE
jgi:hypothetical protein